ncbi:MAG: S9 family peptidase [Caulobacteraceae bacterium]|nr:S9 family peptidase [Caulobacteraceae bacterium]
MRCLTGALAAALLFAAGTAHAEVRRYSIEQLLKVDGFGGLSFSPDNSKIAVSSKRTGISNIYVMPTAGGPLEPLTSSTKETIGLIGYFPRDERLLYSSDQGGNELAHIYARETDGQVRDTTPCARCVARFVDWAQDGQSFFVMTNERNPRYFDLYEVSAKDYARRLIFTNDLAYQVRAVSPDRRYVALSRIVDNASTPTYVFDTREQKVRQITPDRPGISSMPHAFAPEGAVLFYTTDEGREFKALVREDLATGERRIVLAPEWDVQAAGFTRDGRYLLASVNEDARSKPYVFDARTLEPVDVGDLAAKGNAGVIFADDAPLALVVRSDGSTPGDIYLRDLRTKADKRLLTPMPADVDQADLVAGEVVRFASYDGVKAPGILYVPKDAKTGDRRPAVIHVHGGPGDESRIGYRPQVQYLVNHGYVVFEINNRGSSGSGKTFYHMDDRRHGDADLDDVVAAKKMLVETGFVDGDKIAISGQSYGGYMVLAALTFRPEAFAAGIDLYGVSNWPRLLKATPPWWEDLRRLLFTEMGDPEKDAAYLERISPFYHADQIKRPLLVLQGANDPRVLPQESEDIVAKVRANGVPVEYVVFPDEGHGFRKSANQAVAYRAMKDFLDEHLGLTAETAEIEDPMALGR